MFFTIQKKSFLILISFLISFLNISNVFAQNNWQTNPDKRNVTQVNCSFELGDNTNWNAMHNALQKCSTATKWVEIKSGNNLQASALKSQVSTIASGAMRYGSLFAIAAIVVAGLMYVTAAGKDEQIKKAKTTIIYAIAGLLLLLLSFSIVNAVLAIIYGFNT